MNLAAGRPSPLRVAIVGSGPAGFYAAEALLRNGALPVEVDVFDRLPTPYGLVRGGVAPDHVKIKSIDRVLERTARRPSFRFLGNVRLGRDLSVAELRTFYHQVVYATGSEVDRRLGVPGEGMPGSTPATVFVGWYNGHPDYRPAKIRLSARRAAVIGNGNAAIDVTRILLRTPDGLAATDMPGYAREALAASRVREVWLLGRRGPAQAAFSPKELEELAGLDDTDLLVDPSELMLDPASEEEASRSPQRQKNLELLRELAARGPKGKGRTVHLRFCVSPTELLADAAGELRALALCRNRLDPLPDGSVVARPTGGRETLEVGLAITATGFSADRIPGVPFDERTLTVANVDGRVVDPGTRRVVPNEYVVGWARNGARGLIGSHRSGSAEVVGRMLEDWRSATTPEDARPPREFVDSLLARRGVTVVGFEDWKRLDEIEIARGTLRGAPRDKIADVESMLDLLEGRA